MALPYRPWFDKAHHSDPSTGSGLKAVEGACPEAPRRVEERPENLRREASVSGK